MTKMAILTPEKLVELRELAKAATPGPWSLDPMFGVVVADAGVITETRDFPRCDNARFIAAANPETVLALLEAAAELAQLGWMARPVGKRGKDPMLARKVRMLTQEIRNALRGNWRTQAELADLMQESQRTINSRIQCMWRFGELQKRSSTIGRGVEYKLRKVKVLPPRLHVPAVRPRASKPVTRAELIEAIKHAERTGGSIAEVMYALADRLERGASKP